MNEKMTGKQKNKYLNRYMTEWMKWHERIEINELKWMNWHERLEIKEWKRINCQKRPNTHIFLHGFMGSTTWWLFRWHMKSSSCYSPVQILSRSSSKSGLNPSVFHVFFVKSSSRYSLVRIFFNHFPRSRRATTEAETLQRRPRMATLAEKTQGFAPENGFKREFTRSRSLALPNYLMMMMMMMMMWLTWWCGWHDDVVDMMTWLTWWCSWHYEWLTW